LPAQARIQPKLDDPFGGFVNIRDQKPAFSIIDLASDAAYVSADYRSAFPYRLGDGQAEPLADGFLQNYRSMSLERVHKYRIVDRDDEHRFVYRTANGLQDNIAFGIVGRTIAEQNQGAIDLLTRCAERFDHANGIFPPVEPGDLGYHRPVDANPVPAQALINFGKLNETFRVAAPNPAGNPLARNNRFVVRMFRPTFCVQLDS
jgi:hypothetical protein